MPWLIALLALVILIKRAGCQLTPSLQFIVLENNTLGAKCLDGSPPGFYYRPGTGSGSNSWLINLQGGGWCTTLSECADRAATVLGGTTQWKQPSDPLFPEFMANQHANFSGLLSSDPTDNPRFHNWHTVLVLYCDGGCFTGTQLLPWRLNATVTLHLHGALIFEAVVQELQSSFGLNNSSEVLLSGQSAGAIAALQHCDRLAAMLARHNGSDPPRVKCLMDGGFFMDVFNTVGRPYFHRLVMYMMRLHKPEMLPKCTAAYPTSKWKCFFAQYSLPFVQRPVFVINSAMDFVAMAIAYQTLIPDMQRCLYHIQGTNLTEEPPIMCDMAMQAAAVTYSTLLRRNVSDVVEGMPKSGYFIFPDVKHCAVVFPDWGRWKARGEYLPQAIAAWYDEAIMMVATGTGSW